MNEENTQIDNKKLAEDVSSKIEYRFANQFLVKPLEPVIVKKEIKTPKVTDETPKKDENGVEAVDITEYNTEIKDVESDFRKGIVLKIPFNYEIRTASKEYPAMPIEIGDIVVFKDFHSQYFDLCKDTKMVSMHDIIAVVQ